MYKRRTRALQQIIYWQMTAVSVKSINPWYVENVCAESMEVPIEPKHPLFLHCPSLPYLDCPLPQVLDASDVVGKVLSESVLPRNLALSFPNACVVVSRPQP